MKTFSSSLYLIAFSLLAVSAQCQDVTPPQPATEESATVRALVINQKTGAPIPNATVLLQRAAATTKDDKRTWTYRTTTAADGTAQILNIQPDSYYLSATRVGFSFRTIEGFRSVGKLEPGATPEVFTLRMIPAAAVSGIVEDEEGNPLPGMTVTLLKQGYEGGVRQLNAGVANTRPVAVDASGAFVFPAVLPGRYVLQAVTAPAAGTKPAYAPGRTPGQYVDTFYPSSADPAGAASITVSLGVDQTGLRIRMRKGTRLALQGTVDGLPAGTADANVSLIPVLGRDTPLRMGVRVGADPQGPIAADGSFSIDGIQPGTYLATVFSGRIALHAAAFVDMVDRDVDDLKLRFEPGWTFAGRVVFPEGTVAKARNASLMHFGPLEGYSLVPLPIAPDGTFELRNLPAGEYRFGYRQDGMRVKTIELADRTFTSARFALLGTGAERAIITVAAGGATLSTEVEQDRDYQPGFVSVHSWPLSLISGASLIQQVPGSAQISNLEPDTYRVCSWDQDFNQIYEIIQHPANWQRLGTMCETVTLKEDETKQVRLKQIRVAAFN